MNRCEDYPCCGHTDLDPCARQWYDAPDAFDTSVNPHAFCDHQFGDCVVEDEEPECDGDFHDCPDGGCDNCQDDEGDVYYSGTGERMDDDSYIDYLNRY